MNWHERYVHQAAWTRELRSYLFTKVDLPGALRVLEVGCGTGAILSTLPEGVGAVTRKGPQLHGLDIDPGALRQCRAHAPAARLVRGNVLALPYRSAAFDITYCHFLLLWVSDPLHALQEMKRVTVESGYILALAEPDYGARIDAPTELAWLGQRQNEALQSQGAALQRGAELSDLFRRARIRIIETGVMQAPDVSTWNPEAWQSEWEVLEHDLGARRSPSEMGRIKEIDLQAWRRGERRLNVPTYFACGQV